MSLALGLVEFKTVPVAVAATDEMLKASEVELILASPVCPGKFITLVSGPVAEVTTAVTKACDAGNIFVVESHVIANVDNAVIPAVSGTNYVEKIEALGLIETFAAVSAIWAGDAIAKSANVSLLEIRLARGLGGKGEVIFTGQLGPVEAASRAAQDRLERDGSIVSSVVIPRPHKALWGALA
ncbi:MAG: BMC domain-containing protein [Deltaproteobacteria bacterium]|jgi:microcompartment protein CcmL/EutN|nr:BMC domain-containing protein [Deltaproteobacteria bacterium]